MRKSKRIAVIGLEVCWLAHGPSFLQTKYRLSDSYKWRSH